MDRKKRTETCDITLADYYTSCQTSVGSTKSKQHFEAQCFGDLQNNEQFTTLTFKLKTMACEATFKDDAVHFSDQCLKIIFERQNINKYLPNVSKKLFSDRLH